MRYQVTLYNQSAMCGYKGDPARTMLQAMHNAVAKASAEFLNHDRAHPFEFFAAFFKARECWMFRKAYRRVSNTWSNPELGISVQIQAL